MISVPLTIQCQVMIRLINNELGRIWKEAVVAYFRVLFRKFSEETKGKNDHTSGLWTQMWLQYIKEILIKS